MIDLIGQRVERVIVDFAVTITTYEGFELRIESDFDLTHASPDSIDGRTILSATTSEDGTLAIIAVCTPAGGLTSWSSRSIAD